MAQNLGHVPAALIIRLRPAGHVGRGQPTDQVGQAPPALGVTFDERAIGLGRERLGRGDEVALDHRDGRTSGDSGDAWHGGDADREDDQDRGGTEHRDHDQRGDDLRQGEDDVHQSHQHIVELAAVVGGDEADQRAENERQHCGQHRSDEDRLTAVQEAGPHVVTDLGGPEDGVLAGLPRRLERQAHGVALAVRGDDVTEQGDGPEQGDDERANARTPHAVRDANDARWLPGNNLGHSAGIRGGDVGTHRILVRNRGVTRTVATSAAKLVTT